MNGPYKTYKKGLTLCMRFFKAKIISITMIPFLGVSSVASANEGITIAVAQSKVNVSIGESIQVIVTTVPNNICYVAEKRRNFVFIRVLPDFNTGPSGIYSFPFEATKAGGFTYSVLCSLTRNGEFVLNVSTPTPVVVTPTPTPVVVTPTPTPVVVTPTPEPTISLNPAVYIQCWDSKRKIRRSILTRDNKCPLGYVRFFTNEELQRATGQTVAPTPTPVVATPTSTTAITDKNGNTLVVPKDISIRCKSKSTKFDITNVTGPNPKCPLNYRLLLPDDPEYDGPIGGVTSTTPVGTPTPTLDSVGTAPMPEYIWCVHRLTGRSVRSGTPYKPSCPKDYFARDVYGVPTTEIAEPRLPKSSPAPKVITVKTCYKPSDKNRVNGVTVRKESFDGSQPKCPAGYR
jgi:hypothetical protein